MANTKIKVGDSDWWVDTIYPVEGGDGGGVTPGAAPALIVSLYGTGVVGTSVSATAIGLGNPAAVPTYQWTLNGAPISGAVASTIPVLPEYDGMSLNCTMSATNAFGSSVQAASLPIVVTTPAPVVGLASVSPLWGSDGDTFTANVAVTPSTAVVTLQWLLDGEEVVGETGLTIAPTDTGTLTLKVTAVTSGGTVAVYSNPVFVRHIEAAGAMNKHDVITFTDTFGGAAVRPGQKFLILWTWQGGAFTGGVMAGATIDGVAVAGVTAETIFEDVQQPGDYHFMAQLVSGVASSLFDVTMNFLNTPNKPAYLKGYAFQLVNVDLSQIYFRFNASEDGVADADPLVVDDIVIPQNGVALFYTNKVAVINAPPAIYQEIYDGDMVSDEWDFLAGLFNGSYDGILSVSPSAAIADKMALVAIIGPDPLGEVANPTVTGPVTMSYTSPPQEGRDITFGVPTVSSDTESLVYNLYNANVTPKVLIATSSYAFGDPQIVYSIPGSDVGKKYQLEVVPVGGGVSGDGVLSAITETVIAAATVPISDYIDPAKVVFEQTSEANGGIVTNADGSKYAKADTTFLAGITVPANKKLAVIRTVSLPPNTSFVKTLEELTGTNYDGSANLLWRSNSGAGDGVTQYCIPYWKDNTSGALSPALEPPDSSVAYGSKSFVTDIPDAVTPPPVGPDPGTFSEVLSAPTLTSLYAALDARIASGSAVEWKIGLPDGIYGNFNLGGRKLPGKTWLIAVNPLKARFSGALFNNGKNVYMSGCDVDRTLGGASSYGVKFAPASYCGFEWGRVYLGGIVANSGKPGWAPNVSYGIEVNNSGTTNSDHISILGNGISGPASKHIYLNGMFDSYVGYNIGENVGDDFIHFGWGSRNTYECNWGPRAYYPNYDSATGWAHNDFIQCNSQSVRNTDMVIRGNVIMHGPEGLLGNPRQGIFMSKSLATNWLYENNIVVSNSAHGITATIESNGFIVRYNTVLRCTDAPGDQPIVYFTMSGGLAEMHHNVFCQRSGSTSGGADSLLIVIPGSTNSPAAVLTYYTEAAMGSTFYDLRPVSGQPTEDTVGAFQKFIDVITNNVGFPLYSEAYRLWKKWYDPDDQIMPAYGS